MPAEMLRYLEDTHWKTSIVTAAFAHILAGLKLGAWSLKQRTCREQRCAEIEIEA